MMKMNKTLVKNMKDVKWRAIPPLKGPDSQGLNNTLKQVKNVINSGDKANGKKR
tara:strand:+ start:35 stop:196 length:162 start_codon:yes stop_codon:yes gene_type:complete